MPNNVEPLTITQNGTYTPQQAGHGYSPVTVNVDVGFEPDDFADNSVKTSVTGDITLSTATKIVDYAFNGYTGITSINAPEVTSIGGNSVQGCSNLTSFIAPKITSLPGSAFKNLTALTTASFPKITNIYNAGSVFENCTSLTSLSLPNLQRAYSSAYCRNTKISNLVLPIFGVNTNSTGNQQSIIESTMLSNCSLLKALDCHSIFRFDGISNSPLFDTLIIRNYCHIGNSITALDNANFTGTPFASDGTGGTLYVPSAQVSEYQAATNWSTLLARTNNQILSIEGSYYETHYADGTSVPVMTSATYTTISNRKYDNSGGYSTVSGYTASDFVETNGVLDWKLAVTANNTPFSNDFEVQQFNGDEYIGEPTIYGCGKETINGTERYMLQFIFSSSCTKFRFSSNTTYEGLYKMVTQ